MAADPNAVEQAVSRTLRDNLEKIQRTADELHQAVNDMVAACASSRASNALPSMMRAQTSAASLAATLEVLSRFVTGALQPAMRMPFEPEILRVPSTERAAGSLPSSSLHLRPCILRKRSHGQRRRQLCQHQLLSRASCARASRSGNSSAG